MKRVPVPPVPSTLVEIQVATRSRRGVPAVLLVAPAEESAATTESTLSTSDTAPDVSSVRTLDGSPLPEDWRPAAVVKAGMGETHQLPGGRWLLGVGSGPDEEKRWRSAGAALVRAVDADIAARKDTGERPARSVQVDVPDQVPADRVAAFVLGARLGGYTFKVTDSDSAPRLRTVVLITSADRLPELESAVGDAAALAAASGLARDLVNTPSNVKNPDWMARTAERICGDVPGLRVTVRDDDWLRRNGFGGVLAVGGGSASPPRMVELGYRPRGARTHVLLVGKGITFDTGGLSLKPAEGMHMMRTDMSGGAAVIAAMHAIANRKLEVKVTGLVPCAENHVSGSSYRPSDVVTHYGGRTTEIGNTDAEGRIVLADALAYGVRRFAPDVVIDIATLTGAMKVALGLRTGGLFASDDGLADRLRGAGERAGEAFWRMPLLEAHADAVESEVADLRQTPDGPSGVTAALFLREFTGGLPWAHLDIAGPARADKAYGDVTPGGTGFGTRTLVELAASYA